jgi:ABC-type transport system substrate-binding protein
MRDARFRRALSLAIDRDELSDVVYSGLAKPSANTIMPRSELFKPEYATKWATRTMKLANKLLDEIGLAKKGQRRHPAAAQRPAGDDRRRAFEREDRRGRHDDSLVATSGRRSASRR